MEMIEREMTAKVARMKASLSEADMQALWQAGAHLPAIPVVDVTNERRMAGPPPEREKSLPRVTLRQVSASNLADLADLWALLRDREPHQAISHREMPTWEQHRAHVREHRHQGWWMVDADGACAVGSVYLTQAGEIGLSIFRRYQRKGYGRAAVRELMRTHPRDRFLANVNPANAASRALWESLGARVVQVTYELPPQRVGDAVEIPRDV